MLFGSEENKWREKERKKKRNERGWVAPIVEKMVKTQFRWFGNEERSLVDSVVKRFNQVKLVKSLEE